MIACYSGRIDIVRLLISGSADVNAGPERARPLQLTSMNINSQIVDLLRAHGTTVAPQKLGELEIAI